MERGQDFCLQYLPQPLLASLQCLHKASRCMLAKASDWVEIHLATPVPCIQQQETKISLPVMPGVIEGTSPPFSVTL